MEKNHMKKRNYVKSTKLYILALKITKKKNILHYFEKIIFANKEIDIKDTILIVGSPRSGTTWLMEIMATIPGYTYLFEPIQHGFFPASVKAGFQSRTYLPSNMGWPEGEKYLKKIFTGKIASRLPTYQLKPIMLMHHLLSDKLIVKSIRLNRLLPWITQRFQLRHIIFIIRHPCAVVASQLKTGFSGYLSTYPPYRDIFPTIDNILDEASKIDGLDQKLLNRLKSIKTQEELLAASWCLDNFVPLSTPKPHSWTLLTYEKLAIESREEISHLFNEIGEKKIPRSVSRYLKKPSLVTPISELKTVTKTDEQLAKWQKFLSEKQIERILKIVSDFELDFYTKDLEPDYKNINIL